MNEYREGESTRFGELVVQFSAIERAEEKRVQQTIEAETMHKRAVQEWNILYDAIVAIHEKYATSPALSDSKMGGLFPVQPMKDLDVYKKAE